MMSLICPNCQASVESLQDAIEDVLCPSCGISVRKWGGTTADWDPAKHQRTLGKFDLIDLVGAGAFGSVYKARDRELGRTVAVKVPRKTTSAAVRIRTGSCARPVASLSSGTRRSCRSLRSARRTGVRTWSANLCTALRWPIY